MEKSWLLNSMTIFLFCLTHDLLQHPSTFEFIRSLWGRKTVTRPRAFFFLSCLAQGLYHINILTSYLLSTQKTVLLTWQHSENPSICINVGLTLLTCTCRSTSVLPGTCSPSSLSLLPPTSPTQLTQLGSPWHYRCHHRELLHPMLVTA